MSKLHLTLACWNYDRTRGLLEDRVRPDGIDLTYLNLPVEETFFRMVRHVEFDVAEMSLSSYVVSLGLENPPFIAIPVFPSRSFRHSSIYVNRDSCIREPKDLCGKRVGTPEYQITAAVWIRGILADEYGVPVPSVTYYTGGEEEPGRVEKLALDLPPEIRIQHIGPVKTLSQMLDTGEIDALYTARMPSPFAQGSEKVGRLFEDFRAEEEQYFSKTGIFPIMHVIVLDRRVYEKFPWVAQSLYKAFTAAQQETYHDLYETAALKCMLPWLTDHVEKTRKLMGHDFWPYGLDANRKTLSTFLRYSYEQGLAKRRLQPEDLFAPETFESYKL